jgi:hypothetical protein
MGGQFSPRVHQVLEERVEFNPRILKKGSWFVSLGSNFYPKFLDYTLGSKKIITRFFNQVLEERVGFNPWIFKKGSRFVPLSLELYPQIKKLLLDYYLIFQPSLGREGLELYPQIKEDYYLVFQPILRREDRI